MHGILKLLGPLVSLAPRLFGASSKPPLQAKVSPRLRHLALLAFVAVILEQWFKSRSTSPTINVTPPPPAPPKF